MLREHCAGLISIINPFVILLSRNILLSKPVGLDDIVY
jgi:hypothetical protein